VVVKEDRLHAMAVLHVNRMQSGTGMSRCKQLVRLGTVHLLYFVHFLVFKRQNLNTVSACIHMYRGMRSTCLVGRAG